MLTLNDVVVYRADCQGIVAPKKSNNPLSIEPKQKFYYQDEIDHRNTYIYEQAETCKEERAEIRQFAEILVHNKDKAWLGHYIERYYLEEYTDGQLNKEYIANRCEGLYAWTERSRTARRGMAEG